MPELNQEQATTLPIHALSEALKSGRFVRMRRLLSSLHPA